MGQVNQVPGLRRAGTDRRVDRRQAETGVWAEKGGLRRVGVWAETGK